MLRAQLRDAAVALAKQKAHAQVEPRHVWYAVARQFKDHPEVQTVLSQAKLALDPRGTSFTVPAISPAAEALLKTLKSEGDAIAALLEAFSSGVQTVDEASAPSNTLATSSEPQVAKAKQPPEKSAPPSQREDTAAVLAELEALIGLDAVKRQVKRLIAVVQANEERQRAGLAAVNPGLHLVFTGPPGTGKTTVARLIARLYAATGALPGKNFTEATRTDLVAGYVGQTAIKTADVVKRTSPGVLFIDEAYSLTPRHDSDFGAEAVATLVKAMEDDRQKLAVIVAGYDEEMSQFVQSNPGLKSRFKTTIAFPNYAAAELARIFESFARSAGINLAAGVRDKAERVFLSAIDKQDFGNARFARSLFEEAYARMSARAAEDGRVEVAELMEIGVSDVEWRDDGSQRESRRIGFARGE